MSQKYSVNEPVQIKNEVGTSARENCPCGHWLAHWTKYSAQRPGTCAVDGCNETATVGAHVTRPIAKKEEYKRLSYLVPMCAKHNGMHGETFHAKAGTTFVWANVAETCGAPPRRAFMK